LWAKAVGPTLASKGGSHSASSDFGTWGLRRNGREAKWVGLWLSRGPGPEKIWAKIWLQSSRQGGLPQNGGAEGMCGFWAEFTLRCAAVLCVLPHDALSGAASRREVAANKGDSGSMQPRPLKLGPPNRYLPTYL
jgi:hypothetical protein